MNHNNKQTLRHHLRALRRSIPPARRQEASHQLYSDLLPQLNSYRSILSFASRPEEIDLWQLNKTLQEQKRLLLPKVTGDTLEIFAIHDISTQLALSPLGILEPIAEHCDPISPNQIDCVLVPGLGFDVEKSRLGYGKGYYDRFLKTLPSISTFGIGFYEQLVKAPIPTEPHDIPVGKLFLY